MDGLDAGYSRNPFEIPQTCVPGDCLKRLGGMHRLPPGRTRIEQAGREREYVCGWEQTEGLKAPWSESPDASDLLAGFVFGVWCLGHPTSSKSPGPPNHLKDEVNSDQ